MRYPTGHEGRPPIIVRWHSTYRVYVVSCARLGPESSSTLPNKVTPLVRLTAIRAARTRPSRDSSLIKLQRYWTEQRADDQQQWECHAHQSEALIQLADENQPSVRRDPIP